MALAFSYRRFSTKRQERGDSLRRQIAKAEAYAKHHNLILDERSFDDLGTSAFRGLNATEGALGLFLHAIESGTIPKDSWLLVESLDRISRQTVTKALDLFSRIIRTGCTLVTIDDGQHFNTENIDKNWTMLVVALAVMSRAHEESKTKSDRVKLSWTNKRTKARTGSVMKATVPAWLTANATMTGWIVDDQKAQTVNRIFQMALAGHGGPTISKTLNEEQVPLVTQRAPRIEFNEDGELIIYKRARFMKWTAAKVVFMLKNAAVIGMHAPASGSDVIPGYYPAIVDEHIFHLVQETVAQRRYLRAANNGAVHNLFAGMSRCSECNGRMKIISIDINCKTPRKYIRCLNAIEGNCDAKTFPYQPAEIAILRLLADDLSMQIATAGNIPEPDTTSVLQLKRDDLNQRLDRLIDLAAMAPDVKSIAPKIIAINDEIARVEIQLQQVKPATFRVDQLREAAELFETFKGHGEVMDVEMRRKVQTELRRVIDIVYFKPAVGDELPAVAIRYVAGLGGSHTFLTIKPDRHARQKKSH